MVQRTRTRERAGRRPAAREAGSRGRAGRVRAIRLPGMRGAGLKAGRTGCGGQTLTTIFALGKRTRLSCVSCTLQSTSLSFYHYNDVVAFISAQQKRLAIKHADECLSQRAPLSVIATRTIDEQHTFGPKV